MTNNINVTLNLSDQQEEVLAQTVGCGSSHTHHDVIIDTTIGTVVILLYIQGFKEQTVEAETGLNVKTLADDDQLAASKCYILYVNINKMRRHLTFVRCLSLFNLCF